MKDMEQAPNGHIFACTRKSEQECFDRMLFATSRVYGESVLKIRRGDLLFLVNIDTDTLYGTFLPQSQGAKNIVPEAWKGRYPYQVEASRNGTNFYLRGYKYLFFMKKPAEELLQEEKSAGRSTAEPRVFHQCASAFPPHLV
jgi:hypothetical protein